jgi:hypothetical protein
VVVVLVMRDEQQPPPRRGDGDGRAGAERVHLDVALAVRVIDEEAVVPGVARMERHREQALLDVAALDAAADVEEGPPLPAREHDDPACPLDHVEPVRLALRLRHVDRLGEAGSHLPEAVFGPVRAAAGELYRRSRRRGRAQSDRDEHPHHPVHPPIRRHATLAVGNEK